MCCEFPSDICVRGNPSLVEEMFDVRGKLLLWKKMENLGSFELRDWYQTIA